jgi:hypothetical protein
MFNLLERGRFIRWDQVPCGREPKCLVPSDEGVANQKEESQKRGLVAKPSPNPLPKGEGNEKTLLGQLWHPQKATQRIMNFQSAFRIPKSTIE